MGNEGQCAYAIVPGECVEAVAATEIAGGGGRT